MLERATERANIQRAPQALEAAIMTTRRRLLIVSHPPRVHREAFTGVATCLAKSCAFYLKLFFRF